MEIELLDADGRPLASGSATPPPRRPLAPAWSALAVGVIALVALVALSGAVQAVVRDRLSSQLDRTVATRAEQVAAAIADGDVDLGRLDLPEELAVQVMQSPGVVVASTPGLADTPIIAGVMRRGVVTLADAVVVVDGQREERRVGSTVLPTPPGVAGSTLVVVALPVAERDRALDRVRVGTAVGVVLGTAAAAASAWRTGRRRRAAVTGGPSGAPPPPPPAPPLAPGR